MKLADEHIRLVHLIRHHDQILLGRELENGLDIFFGERCACGVARVDHDDGADVCALSDGFGVGFLDDGEVGAPGFGFVEIVRDTAGVKEGESGGV